MSNVNHETESRKSSEMTREELIAWLEWNDPDGTYRDEDAIAEFEHVIEIEMLREIYDYQNEDYIF